MHLSPNHLAAVYTMSWGHTPRAHLTLIRVERLARYLRETSIPVKQCVRLVGWQNHTRAVRVFRSVMGLAPAEYRLSWLRDEVETFGHQSRAVGHPSTDVPSPELPNG